MIVYINTNGTAIAVQPSPVYQGVVLRCAVSHDERGKRGVYTA